MLFSIHRACNLLMWYNAHSTSALVRARFGVCQRPASTRPSALARSLGRRMRSRDFHCRRPRIRRIDLHLGWTRLLRGYSVTSQAKMQDFADLPYAWNRVSSFQRAVYEAALHVKPGQTWSYGQLAAAIAQPTEAARAVGAALGQNPWPLLVPCHRFIGADGRMTGFSAPGGIKMKLRLLALEGAELFPE
jgi:O-6-methylguanine DNA methyltransferase